MVLERARAIVSVGGDGDDGDDVDIGFFFLSLLMIMTTTKTTIVIDLATIHYLHIFLHISLLYPAGAASFPTRGKGG